MKINDVYYSNYGKGPGVARILKHEKGCVTLELARWPDSRRRERVVLPEKFFRSRACGWRKAKTEKGK